MLIPNQSTFILFTHDTACLYRITFLIQVIVKPVIQLSVKQSIKLNFYRIMFSAFLIVHIPAFSRNIKHKATVISHGSSISQIRKQICLIYSFFKHFFKAVPDSHDILLINHSIPGIIGTQHFHIHFSFSQ